ncbi:MAG: PAS domain S-box protein, partial [Ignavibacteriae bacterium]|nr:PAS domain S-box protein [Ignavibacteriota bacterium]
MEYKINIENSPNKELSSKTKKNFEEKITLKNGTNGRSLKKSKDLIETNEIGNLIVENSHDGILIVGSNYKIEFINNQLCSLIGYQREEILNQDFRLLFQSDNKEEIMELYKSHLAGKNKNPDFHLHLKTKDNIEKIFDIKAVLYNDKLGATKTLAQFKDITESKHAELLLKQSEEKFRSIVENSHNGILIVDNNFHLEYVNEKFCEILKSTKEKLIGSDFRAFLSKDSLALVVERYEKRQRGIKTPSEYEINIVCDDGEVKAVKLNSNSISIANSPKTIAQILDITLSKKKEKLQNVLLKISQAVNEVNNLRGFLEIVRFKLNNIIDTKNFYVALYDSSSDTYTFPYHEDEFDKIDDFSQLDLKNSLTDFVRRKNQAILVDEKTQLLLEEQGEIEGVVGNICPIWIGAPLVVDNVVVGVIGLQNYHHANTYSLDDLELLKIVSENVSSAIWKKQIIDKLTERELRYRDFISRSSEGIYRLDFNPPVDTTLPVKEQVDLILKNSSIGECNDMFAQMYDVENPEKLIGQSLINFYHDSIEEEDENYKSNLTFVQNNYKIINSLTEEINSKGEKIYLLNNSVGVVKNGFLEHAWGIQRDITEKKIYEDVLRQIAEGIYSTMDDFFFNSLVKFLGKSLSVDYAIIAKLDYNKVQASTLACWNKDKIVENFNFKIKGSPCEIVIANGEASYLQNVSTLFPNDSFLQENIYH